ncbi:DUF3147 family protein [Methyloligella sp. 2.7D]|uniref:DUF3147 family protein n=1 Tax=unclassified Methyloligella TaxID=2625955 RepID=UPI00157CB5BF|nr:DUF3147 family protein [Methyloligella sp. GL2]QKP77254.1 DUF3147 family protein [Methyloligella sp. GL2]
MAYAALKLLITSVLIVLISEIGKRNAIAGAILASIPLVSVLAMIWLYIDTKDVEKIASLASGIVWLVLPSLVLFIALPLLLRRGVEFYLSLGISIALTVAAYFLMLEALKRFGLKL